MKEKLYISGAVTVEIKRDNVETPEVETDVAFDSEESDTAYMFFFGAPRAKVRSSRMGSMTQHVHSGATGFQTTVSAGSKVTFIGTLHGSGDVNFSDLPFSTEKEDVLQKPYVLLKVPQDFDMLVHLSPCVTLKGDVSSFLILNRG